MPWYKSKYFLAFIVALIVGVFGAAQQFVIEITPLHPADARVLGALLIGLALFVDILPKPAQIVQPTVNVEEARQVNVQPAPNAARGDAPPAQRVPDAPAVKLPRSTK